MPTLNLGSLSISSPSFEPDGPIPDRFAGDGDGASPDLRWSGVPDGTKELALVVHDPDAPLTDGFTHWVVTGIDPTSTGVDSEGFPAGSVVVGLNEKGDAEYFGPAPPPGHGPHHYFFHLYALDAPVGNDPVDRRALLERIDDHIIEQARLVGTYEARD